MPSRSVPSGVWSSPGRPTFVGLGSLRRNQGDAGRDVYKNEHPGAENPLALDPPEGGFHLRGGVELTRGEQGSDDGGGDQGVFKFGVHWTPGRLI